MEKISRNRLKKNIQNFSKDWSGKINVTVPDIQREVNNCLVSSLSTCRQITHLHRALILIPFTMPSTSALNIRGLNKRDGSENVTLKGHSLSFKLNRYLKNDKQTSGESTNVPAKQIRGNEPVQLPQLPYLFD